MWGSLWVPAWLQIGLRMLTEGQFREIADSLQEIVTELKKANEVHKPLAMTFSGRPGVFVGGGGSNQHNFERSDHSGPSIA